MEHISNASAADAEFVAALGDADFCAPLAAATVPLSAASAASASSESLDSLVRTQQVFANEKTSYLNSFLNAGGIGKEH